MTSGSLFHSAYQTTIAGSVTCSGIGVHTGQTVNLTLHPAEADTGIQFIRLDVPEEKSVVRAFYLDVTDTMLGTTITNEYGVSVSTIEHLMAALWGMGVDNAVVTLSGPEVPIMDGSSEPFVFLIECAGVKQLSAHRDTLEVLKKVTVQDGSSIASIRPFDGFALDITIEFPHAAIPRQRAIYDFSRQTFRHALSRARTFGFAKDVEMLRAKGLARGGSLDNAVVIGDEGILNEGGLRYNDEFIRHKALDCVGDYFLTGMRMRGMVTANRPGHGMNNKLLRTLLADRSAWRLVTRAFVQPSLAAQHASVPAANFSH